MANQKPHSKSARKAKRRLEAEIRNAEYQALSLDEKRKRNSKKVKDKLGEDDDS